MNWEALEEPEGTALGVLRRVGQLASQRAADIILIGILGATLPRLLGPEAFGQLNVVNAAVRFLAFVAAMGSIQVMSRFVPPMQEKGDTRAISRLFSGFLMLRSGSGLAAAGICLVVLSAWVPSVGLAVIAVASVTVLVRTLANVPFALFLGLDRAERYGLGELLRNLLTLTLALPAAFLLGLPGAVFASLTAEAALLGLGLFWTRAFIVRVDRSTLQEMTAYAGHQRVFLITDILASLIQQGTGPLIKVVGGTFGDVAFFAAGHTLYLLSGVLWQATLSFAPSLTRERGAPQSASVLDVIEALVRLVAVVCVILTAASLLVSRELVTLVLGPAFAPAAVTLAPLALALLAAVVGHVLRAIALAWDRIDIAFEAVGAQFLVLAAVAPPLIRAAGPQGAAIATLMSLSVSTFVWWRHLRGQARGLFGSAARALALGSPVLLMAAFFQGASLPLRASVLMLGLILYVLALVRSGILSAREIRGWRGGAFIPR